MNVDVTTRGPVDHEMIALAQEAFADLETAVGRHLDQTHVVLRQEKPSFPQPARAEGDVSLGGKTIRGQVEADNMPRAIHAWPTAYSISFDATSIALPPSSASRPEAPEGKWSHDTWVPLRPSQSLLASGERDVIRRKVFSLVPLKAIEAAELMTELDHAFYLFHDSDRC
ncbi:MAG: sigma 54 modulation/S30EA ribosomal C-terminal domain-containing protein [Solirubrobacterales bacterium]|nr:sigma 54 modulation/S30EA ribosomal C-terminal domain-containing protein [Solirubrobacterales bacterium]